jgi:hypothetical protein
MSGCLSRVDAMVRREWCRSERENRKRECQRTDGPL